MNYSTIIWDWNGTLLNDIKLCVDIVSEMVKNHRGEPLGEEEYKAVFGFPISDYYKRIGIDFEKESFEELTRKFIGNYNSNVRNCNLHENVTNTLNHFQSKNVNQFILTAAHKKDVEELLLHYSINEYFTGIEGLDNYKAESKVQRGKALINQHRIKKESTVLIGDTIHDYEVAQKIGVDCILISNGHQSRERLMAEVGTEGKVMEKIDQLYNS
jgi:phosphoglycolate phosphatase